MLLWCAAGLAVAVPIVWITWRYAVPALPWTPPTGTPDAISEVALTFEDGGWLHVSLGLTANQKSIAVKDALLRVRIAPCEEHEEAVRLETRIGLQHFVQRREEAVLDVEFPCNLRGRVPPGSTVLDAHVALVVTQRAPLEARAKLSVTPSAIEGANQLGSARK